MTQYVIKNLDPAFKKEVRIYAVNKDGSVTTESDMTPLDSFGLSAGTNVSRDVIPAVVNAAGRLGFDDDTSYESPVTVIDTTGHISLVSAPGELKSALQIAGLTLITLPIWSV